MFDTAVCFVNVGAIWEFAFIDKGSNIAIESGHFFGNYIPKLELTDPGGIHDEAAGLYRNQRRACSGMFSFLIILANDRGCQLERGINSV